MRSKLHINIHPVNFAPEMNTTLQAISLSHQKAPVEIRELIYIKPGDIRRLMLTIQDAITPIELMILSTCNRTEVYYVGNEASYEHIIRLLLIEKGISFTQEYLRYFDIIEGDQAIHHLFEVSMGLKSGVVGDLQISNQVKEAYSISHELTLAGPVLHRLLHTIFHTNKRVQGETNFRDGAASVSYAAVETAEITIADPSEAKVLVVGLGEIGGDVARNLKYSSFRNVTLMNRSQAKANELSEETGFPTLPFEALAEMAGSFDVIFSAVNSSEPILTHSLLDSQHLLHHQYLFDLSVPRSIHPDVEQIPGVVLFNIDEIQVRASEALSKRLESIPAVEKIIQEEIAGYQNWSRELTLSPTIHLLKEALENLRKEEIARYLKNLDEKEIRIVEEITKNLVQKFMKLPVIQLKEACKRGEADQLIAGLHTLFNLEVSKTKD